MIREHTLAMPRQSFLTILSLLMLVVIAAVTVYGVLPKYKAWAKVNQSHQLLEQLANSAVDLDTQILDLETRKKALEKQLKGDSASLPFNQFESHVIGQLQQVAWQHNVKLTGIAPKKGAAVDRFREMLFDVKLTGDFFDIHRLLKDFSNKLGFVVVKQIELTPGRSREKQELNVSMTLASYRMEGAG